MTETKKPTYQHGLPRKDPPPVYTAHTPSVNKPYEEVDSFWIKPGSMARDVCDAFERERLED